MRRRDNNRGGAGGALLVGAIVGGAVASKRAASNQQQQMQQQQQSQAQLAQAQAEANYAQAQAQQTNSAPVAQPVVYAQPTQPPPQQYAQPAAAPPDTGRAMLNEALSDGADTAASLDGLKKQLNVTQMMCEQALGLYRKSLELNKAAQSTNTKGVVLDRFTRAPALDLAMDAKRDSQVKASTQPAEQASKMLVEGFAKIPDALRVRYPEEMSQVGNVPASRLAVGGFGRSVVMSAAFGQRGENLNDVMMAKKIADNQREIGQCMQVVQEQLTLMQIVQAHLDRDLALSKQAAAAQPLAQAVPQEPRGFPPAPPQSAMPPPPAIAAVPMLTVRAPHVVDEVAMAPYGIISVPQGATVRLVKGTLEGGLGAPYQDYIEVDFNGKVGKISRLIVAPAANPGLPPPAIF